MKPYRHTNVRVGDFYLKASWEALTGCLWHLQDGLDGAHSCFQGSPLWVVSVLSFLQQVLATAEVGVLIEHPGPLQNLAGLDLAAEPLFLHRLHVFWQVQGLPVKVWAVVQLQLARPFGLTGKQWKTCSVWCMACFCRFILAEDSRSWWSCRIWCSHWNRSSDCSRCIPPGRSRTGSLCSCCARTGPTSPPLPWRSCICGWSQAAPQSPLCSHRTFPGSPGPRKTQSGNGTQRQNETVV